MIAKIQTLKRDWGWKLHSNSKFWFSNLLINRIKMELLLL
jgi:hypothetical protein